jgi:hypothetical protein
MRQRELEIQRLSICGCGEPATLAPPSNSIEPPRLVSVRLWLRRRRHRTWSLQCESAKAVAGGTKMLNRLGSSISATPVGGRPGASAQGRWVPYLPSVLEIRATSGSGVTPVILLQAKPRGPCESPKIQGLLLLIFMLRCPAVPLTQSSA